MNCSLRVVTAGSDPGFTEYLDKCLSLLGHELVGRGSCRSELVERCRALSPDLVVCDAGLPDVDGPAAAVEVFRSRPVPIILIADHHDPGLVERAASAPVLAYFVKPVAPTNLLPAVSIALRRFAEFEAVRREVEGLRKALDERKVIERAKGILMRKSGLGEADAFHRLQQLARNSNRKVADIAGSILTAEEAYQPAVG